jgi:hypothetical protein
MIQKRLSNDRMPDFLVKARLRGRTAAPAKVLADQGPPERRQWADVAGACRMANAEDETIRIAR